MIPRLLEPEAMDDPAEAREYDTMDHDAVNRAFVDDLLAARPPVGDVGDFLDLGTGTAQIPIELVRRDRRRRVTAVDLSRSMLAIASENVAAAGLGDRIKLRLVDAKRLPFADGRFACVISNSIVHHIPAPLEVVREAARVTAAGGLLFFRDLMRPASTDQLERLVNLYAGDASPRQRKLFADSLRAALTLEEMQELVDGVSGVAPGDRGEAERPSVAATSDRHWTWTGRKA